MPKRDLDDNELERELKEGTQFQRKVRGRDLSNNNRDTGRDGRTFIHAGEPSLSSRVGTFRVLQRTIVRKPLWQEDTCHRSEHTTSHQKQSRISELNRILEDAKSLLADTAISLKDKQDIVLGMARVGTELVLLNDGRVGDTTTGIGSTLVLPPLNVEDAKHHFGEVKGFP